MARITGGKKSGFERRGGYIKKLIESRKRVSNPLYLYEKLL